jgi:hypothetical protein
MKYGLGNCFEQRQCFCNVSEWYCVSVNVIFEKTPFLYGFPPLSPSHVTGNATSVHRWIELIKTKKMVYHYRGSHARWLRSEGGAKFAPPVRSRNQNWPVRASVKRTVSLECKNELTFARIHAIATIGLYHRHVYCMYGHVNTSLHSNDTVRLKCLHKLFSTEQLIFAVL